MGTDETIVENMLFSCLLWLNIVMKNELIQWAFDNYKDDR